MIACTTSNAATRRSEAVSEGRHWSEAQEKAATGGRGSSLVVTASTPLLKAGMRSERVSYMYRFVWSLATGSVVVWSKQASS